MATKPMHFLVSFLFVIIPSALGDYNVLDYGAVADGATDSTHSFLSAWDDACTSAGTATINVPRGSYLVGQATFSGPCKSDGITIQIEGTLVAPSNYESHGSSERWLLFQEVQGVSIVGGTLDGRGSDLWACKASSGNCPDGVSTLAFNNAMDIVISGLTSMNSQLYHIVIDGCMNVEVQGVKIIAPGDSPNTDGIHVQGSTHVTISGTGIKTGDDCISVGPGTMNLWVEQVACGPGHGISIGSLGKEFKEGGVQNVTVTTVTFTGTENGLRIKSWARPSSGFVRGVTFEHATMQNVQNPIIIDQNYCPNKKNCPDQSSGVTISDVTYNDIQGSSATQVAMKFDCSSSHPCSGIQLEDINLTYEDSAAQASCNNAAGSASGSVVPPSCL